MEADIQTKGQVNRHTHHNTSLRYDYTAHHVYSLAAMEHDKQLYWITAYGGCLHSLWEDLGYMFQSILKSLRLQICHSICW